MFVVWENLCVEIPTQRRKLLSELNGYAESGRIMAVMGPSGSGKSTLLDSLSGRLCANVKMKGKVLVNAKPVVDCRNVSYVTQEDFFLGTLTVRETITYSAHLRLSPKKTKQEIDNIIETTIMEMGLQDCVDTMIGNWHRRGISNGEKRRLSISVEILTQPDVLFLDEPTTGLDSAAAFFVVQALANIAYDGKIVVSSIHQPSSDVFDLFDDLILLSNGEVVYFGEAKLATKFFGEAGFPCPARRSPSDHFLRCVCLDFDSISTALRHHKLLRIQESTDNLMIMRTSDIRATLIDSYKLSEYFKNTKTRIQEILKIEAVDYETCNGCNFIIRWWKQLCVLTRRSFLNMSRDIGYYWLRLISYIFVAISMGLLFLNLGDDQSGQFLARQKLTGFIYGFMVCLSFGGLPFFIEELKVYFRERSNNHYGEGVVVLSNFLSSIPYLMLISFCTGSIIYSMVKFHPGFSHYAFFCLNLFCCISIVESVMMIVASLVPNVLMGIGVGTAVNLSMMMASEISRRVSDIPKFFWQYPMSYLSFTRWAFEGQIKNDMIGLAFDNLLPGDLPKLRGEEILKTILGISVDRSKWLDLTNLLCLLLAYRVLFYIVLRYKKR